MPIAMKCECGTDYNFKDEYAGKSVQCPKCKKVFAVCLQGQDAATQPGDQVFNRNKFLLRQKHFAISEKYDVCDEKGVPIIFVQRPMHLLRNLGAIFAGFMAGGLVATLFGILASLTSGALQAVLVILAVLGGLFGIIAVSIMLYAKRHITFYRDKTKKEKLLEVLQDKKVQIINATFTVRSPDGAELATLHKNYLYNIIRKRWYCYKPDKSILCLAKEDSIILSLIRRLLGNFFGLLRTNFIILEPAGEKVIGEFNRNFTILDRYVLDMSADAYKTLDRRIAIALGVMLDTGEKR
ncbi:MAG: hypothetical protein HY811_07985 [Planctomycetes bacterium]|nr:hypothetical protein [Planctomycetota bacterium]